MGRKGRQDRRTDETAEAPAGEAAAAASSDGLLVLDTSGVVRFANPAASALLRRDSLIGAQLGIPIAAGDVVEFELLGEAPRTLEIAVTETRWAGEQALVATLRDVTARVRKDQHLEDEIAARETVLHSTAHELKNPIHILKGYTELLRDHWGRIEEADRRDYLERMSRQLRRMERLVADSLTMARAEADNLHPETEVVSLAEVLADIVRDYEARAANLVIDCPPDLLVQADRMHVIQIVTNLVDNAIRYGKPPIELIAAPRNGTVELSVRDHGEGLPDDLEGRTFTRFARSAKHARVSGSGLGLWIVSTLAASNGGSARVSPSGDGTVITVTLPAGSVQG